MPLRASEIALQSILGDLHIIYCKNAKIAWWGVYGAVKAIPAFLASVK